MTFNFLICTNSCKMRLGSSHINFEKKNLLTMEKPFFLDSFLWNSYLRWKQNSTAASCLYHNENKCIHPGNMELPCVQQFNMSSAMRVNYLFL